MSLCIEISSLPPRKYTVLDFELFRSEIQDLAVLPMDKALAKTCGMIAAIPQNLLHWFKGKLCEIKQELDHNTWQWLMLSIKKRMLALELLN